MTEVLYVAEYKHLKSLELSKIEVRNILFAQYGKSIQFFVQVEKLASIM